MRIQAFLILAAGLIALAGARPVCAQSQTTTVTVTNTGTTTTTLPINSSTTDNLLPTTRPLILTTTVSGMFVPVPGSGNTSVLGASVTIQTFGDANNTVFGEGFPADNFTFTVTDPAITSFFNVNFVTGFNPPGAYSLTTKFSVTLPAQTELENAKVTVLASSAVPEPGSLALLFGLGVTGVGFLRRKRAH